jgi:hypothetical protein
MLTRHRPAMIANRAERRKAFMKPTMDRLKSQAEADYNKKKEASSAEPTPLSPQDASYEFEKLRESLKKKKKPSM